MYEGGKVTVRHGLDMDYWSVFEIRSIVKSELGYHDDIKIWWKAKELSFEEGLRELLFDPEATEAANYALGHPKKECDIYVVHELPPDIVHELPHDYRDMENCDGNEYSDNSLDEEDMMDDSEGERCTAVDDGFDSVVVPSVGAKRMKQRVPRMVFEAVDTVQGCTRTEASTRATQLEIGEGVVVNDIDPVVVAQQEVDDDAYFSDELDSCDSEDEDGNKNRGYPRFRKEQMRKDFEFTKGMEFSSINEFKDALREHCLLNGKEIRWLKNEKERARAVCRAEDCNFEAFVSRVRGTTSFRLKLLLQNTLILNLLCLMDKLKLNVIFEFLN